MTAYRAVIFDLGGTLIEYAGPYQRWPELETPGLEAAYGYLRDRGLPLPPFEAVRDAAFAILPGRWQEATDGKRNLRLVEFLGELLATLQIAGAGPRWIEAAALRYQAAVCSQATLISGAPQVLRALKEEGYQIALLSNTMFDGSAHMADLRRFGLDSCFDATLFSADLNLWKPSAAPFLHLLEELRVTPANAVFVGDSPHHDIVGGKAAGLYTIYFRSSTRFGEPDGVQPDATIYRLGEVATLLSDLARAN
jgi:HAD superfamily hydrolase (TIGR01509 family)